MKKKNKKTECLHQVKGKVSKAYIEIKPDGELKISEYDKKQKPIEVCSYCGVGTEGVKLQKRLCVNCTKSLKESWEVYNDFWKDIVEKKGEIDKDQLVRELYDWHYVMEQLPSIYSEITGGLLSKPMYSKETVLSAYYDANQRDVEENYVDKSDIKSIIQGTKQTDKEKLMEIFTLVDEE